jgi:hypothetical protein
MVDVPDFIDIPIFGGSAAKIQPSPTVYAGGFLPAEVLPAENFNWFTNGLTGNGVTEQDSIISVVTEMKNFLAAYGVSPNPALFNQFLTTFQAQLVLKANLASPVFTGTVTIPAVPAPSAGANPATKIYVDSAQTTLQNNIDLKAAINSPTFTGSPAAPTPSALDNSTKIATTAYVDSAGDSFQPIFVGSYSGAITFNSSRTVTALGSVGQCVVYINSDSSSHTLTMPASGTYLVLPANGGSATVLGAGILAVGGAIVVPANVGAILIRMS